MVEPISILKAGDIYNSEPEIRCSDLFQLPEVLEAIAPGEAWYGKWEIGGIDPVYFPFTGQKWLWKWRIYQPMLDPVFHPIAFMPEVPAEAWKAWMTWMERKCWFAHWAFAPEGAIQPSQWEKKYLLSLENQDFKLKLMDDHFHKENYTMANFLLVPLEAGDFFRELNLLISMRNAKSWKPVEKEIKSLQRFGRISLKDFKNFYWAIFENGKCLSLFQLAKWNDRIYTLFSHHVKPEQQFQGWLYLIQKLWSQWEIWCKFFVFPAQTGPGINALFLQFGAVEEKNGIYIL